MMRFGAVGLLMSLSACHLSGVKSGSASEVASTPTRNNYRANHCEVFVDKVRLSAGSHGYFGATMYVKALLDRIDGPIAKENGVPKVGFYGRHTYRDSNNTPVTGEWKEYEVKTFVGSADYFEIKEDSSNVFHLAGDYSSNHVHEGSFWVETERGTRYWANAADGGNFRITMDMVRPLQGNNWSLQSVAYEHGQGLHRVPKTADALPGMNPQKCR